MPSQFFGLTIAYTGLLASNAALNTTSNNIVLDNSSSEDTPTTCSLALVMPSTVFS